MKQEEAVVVTTVKAVVAKPKVIYMSEDEFTLFVGNKFAQVEESDSSVYDRLIAAWPTSGITTACIENRKLFNKIYDTLSEGSGHPIDHQMRTWVNSSEYKIVKRNE